MSIDLEKNLSWDGSLLGILSKQLFRRPKPLPASISLKGKRAIVTGSNGGVGFEAARQLLELGVNHLIMAVRSQARGDAAAAKLKAEHPRSTVDVVLQDMADPVSVQEFVEYCRTLDHIDYVILNAGMQNHMFQKSDKTGHEIVLQVNYFSTALLAWSLAPIMKEKRRTGGQPPVLSVVGSDTMWLSRLEPTEGIFTHMDEAASFAHMKQYMDSKLLIMQFVYQLSRKYDANDVIINVINPGLCNTNLGGGSQDQGFVVRVALSMLHSIFGRHPKVGASNYIYALTIPGAEAHGSFISDWDIAPYPRLIYSEKGHGQMKMVWAETLQEFKSMSSRNYERRSK